MMTPRTIQQLLQVFRTFRDNYASGMPLHRCYHEAVRAVATTHSVTYQTIGDGCRRRLKLDDINQLYELLTAWVKGDPRGLARQLKENADRAAHDEIDQFFSTGQTPISEKPKVSAKALTSEEPETITFRLPAREARMLRALAELEGVSVSELTGLVVCTAVRNRMAAAARTIIKDTEAHA
jgi:hypothetical protein